jgi:nitrite reductase/ring-hydroxylating ferredoxin subunit
MTTVCQLDFKGGEFLRFLWIARLVLVCNQHWSSFAINTGPRLQSTLVLVCNQHWSSFVINTGPRLQRGPKRYMVA